MSIAQIPPGVSQFPISTVPGRWGQYWTLQKKPSSGVPVCGTSSASSVPFGRVKNTCESPSPRTARAAIVPPWAGAPGGIQASPSHA
ncbi:MAG TPA: hypothetical protein VLT82_16570 [Myxococcaceae bacterium]|nr:hypothetical protein [Myxococcaceae bacterium]